MCAGEEAAVGSGIALLLDKRENLVPRREAESLDGLEQVAHCQRGRLRAIGEDAGQNQIVQGLDHVGGDIER